MTTANLNVRQILLKRGNTATVSSYVGPIGELVLDANLKMVRVQDGVTPGGVILANSTIQQNQIDAINANVANLFAGPSLTITGNLSVTTANNPGGVVWVDSNGNLTSGNTIPDTPYNRISGLIYDSTNNILNGGNWGSPAPANASAWGIYTSSDQNGGGFGIYNVRDVWWEAQLVDANKNDAAYWYFGFENTNNNAFTIYGPGGAPLSIAANNETTIAGNVKIGLFLEGTEMSEPAAPPANGFRIYAEDNGSGKTRLMVKFATGAPQQLAIEP